MYSIGIDIGGTNIAGGVVSESDALLNKRSVPFPGKDDPMASIDAMERLVDGLLADAGIALLDVHSIGAVVPGSIDYRNGVVLDAYNLGYYDFPLVKLLRERFPDTDVYIENDANGAALAEYYCGAFRGHSSGLLITLGTGVGGGMILDDKLFVGADRNGFEFGHATLQFGGEPCTCGNIGCIEAYCSATALIRDGRRAAEAEPESMIAARSRAGEKLDAKLIIDCAKAGDPTAKRLFDDYTAHLGAAVVVAANVLDPAVVAFGGGVGNAGECLYAPVNAWVDKYAFFRKHPKVVPAQMGNDAGIVGAAMLYRQR